MAWLSEELTCHSYTVCEHEGQPATAGREGAVRGRLPGGEGYRGRQRPCRQAKWPGVLRTCVLLRMDRALPAQSETAETTGKAQSNPAGCTKVKTGPSTPSQKLRPQVHLRLEPMNPTPVLFQPLANMGRYMWCPAVLTCPLDSQRRHTTCPSISSHHISPTSAPWVSS